MIQNLKVKKMLKVKMKPGNICQWILICFCIFQIVLILYLLQYLGKSDVNMHILSSGSIESVKNEDYLVKRRWSRNILEYLINSDNNSIESVDFMESTELSQDDTPSSLVNNDYRDQTTATNRITLKVISKTMAKISNKTQNAAKTTKPVVKKQSSTFIQFQNSRLNLDNASIAVLSEYCKRTLKLNQTSRNETITKKPNCVDRTEELFAPNMEKCKLRKLGTPVYSASLSGSKYGAFIKDAMPRKKSRVDKIWITRGYTSNILYEYDNPDQIDANRPPSDIYYLPQNYYGTGHVIYQGSFYYHSYDLPNLILRYDLSLRKILANHTLNLMSNETNPKYCRVYTVHNEHVGCIDFSIDENGLWIVYRNGSRNFIYVAKLDSNDLLVQKRIEIEIYPIRNRNKQKRSELETKQQTAITKPNTPNTGNFGDFLNGFIICGKVYFLQYHYAKNTTVRYVYDLYNKDKFNYLQSIQFLQPFNRNTQLTYNPFDQRLYAWDSDYLLTYSTGLVSDDTF